MLTREVRYAVEDLIDAYVHSIDDDKLEEWPSFFATECKYTVMPRENLDQGLQIPLISCDSQGILNDREPPIAKPIFTFALLPTSGQ